MSGKKPSVTDILQPEFTGLVLAGGRSVRMGQDKSRLQINGDTLLERSIALLRSVGATNVLVSSTNDSDDLLAADVIQDIYPDKGPLGGIHSALSQTNLPLLIVAVDMPLMNTELLFQLLNLGQSEGQAAYYRNYMLPLYLPNKVSTFKYLDACLSSTQSSKQALSVKRLLQHEQALTLECNDNIDAGQNALNPLSNVNTPEQWQNVCALFQTIKN